MDRSNEVIRILIVEDVESDAVLAERRLKRGALRFSMRRVETQTAFLEQLDAFQPDVVLADYSLPNFSGMRALDLTRRLSPETPFIFVSGAMGEERAIECLRRGATDYVLKDKLGRLEPAVRRALQEANERREYGRTASALAESERRYRALVETSPDAIILAGLEGGIIMANERAAELARFEDASEIIGNNLLDFIAPQDRRRGRRQLLEACRTGCTSAAEYEAAARDGTTFPADIRVSLIVTAEGRPEGLVAVVRDISDRRQAQVNLQASLARLRSTLHQTVSALSSVAERRDPYTAGHERRVAELARAIASELGLSGVQIDVIHTAALLHDIGKVVVPAEILTKPGSLNRFEFGIIKMHPRVGWDIVKGIDFVGPVAKTILQHHERLDGSGYPGRLGGHEITTEAKILSVADVVEAMSSHRPYRPRHSVREALEEIERGAGVIYDEPAATACRRLLRRKGPSKFEWEPGVAQLNALRFDGRSSRSA